MKKNDNQKPAKIKKEKYRSEQTEEILKLVKVLLIVVAIVVLVYFFTRIFVTKDLFNSNADENTVTEGSINYDTTIVGQMFNKPEKEYYVILYDAESTRAMYYSTIITKYQSAKTKDLLRIYFVDLSNEVFNKKYYTEDEAEINSNTTDLTKFKVGKLTLLHIKEGKIVNVVDNEEDFALTLTVK